MTRLPRVTGQDVVRALERAGFSLVRQGGNHVYLRNGEGRSTVVFIHAGETTGPGLLAMILRDAGLNQQSFEHLLQRVAVTARLNRGTQNAELATRNTVFCPPGVPRIQ